MYLDMHLDVVALKTLVNAHPSYFFENFSNDTNYVEGITII